MVQLFVPCVTNVNYLMVVYSFEQEKQDDHLILSFSIFKRRSMKKADIAEIWLIKSEY